MRRSRTLRIHVRASVKVLIVDADAKAAATIARLLESNGHVVEIRDAAIRAMGRPDARGIDVIVIESRPPDIDAPAIVTALRKRGVTTPVLIVSAHAGVADRVLGLRAGADDYVTRPFAPDELLARVESLDRRRHHVVSIGELEIDRATGAAARLGKRIDLTTREMALLACLAARDGEVVSRAELLRDVWGAKFDPGTTVLEVQMSRLRQKLGVNAAVIETVRGRGYRLREE